MPHFDEIIIHFYANLLHNIFYEGAIHQTA